MKIVFSVTQRRDGGFVAECLSRDIITQGDTWAELRANTWEAVAACFPNRAMPSGLRLQLVRCNPPQADPRPVLTFLTHNDDCTDVFEIIVSGLWKDQYEFQFHRFKSSVDLQELAASRPFDGVFCYLGNISGPIPDSVPCPDCRFGGVIGFFGQFKKQFGKPVIVAQGMDLFLQCSEADLTFIIFPISLELLKPAFDAVFTDCLALRSQSR